MTLHRSARLAALALAPTVVLTIAAMAYPPVFTSLRRDPEALANGEVWRLVSPVLVQRDALEPGGGWRALAVFALVGALLIVSERQLGALCTLILYGLGALVGHAVGELWQPYGAGCSVAGCGVLGALGAGLLLARRRPQLTFGAALILVLAVVGSLYKDIHGPPVLAGAVAGPWMFRRSAPSARLGPAVGVSPGGVRR